MSLLGLSLGKVYHNFWMIIAGYAFGFLKFPLRVFNGFGIGLDIRSYLETFSTLNKEYCDHY